MRVNDERGSGTPLAVIAVVLAIVATLAMAELGSHVVDAGRARTAADAAALAGVEGGQRASARLAAEHGATLLSWSSSGPSRAVTVTVTVRVGDTQATAAATNRADGP